ncbi:hypothetical protein LSAT2_010835, partial [Lamellibrachia satsuma]
MGNDQAYLLVTYKRYFMSTEMMMLKSNMSLNTPGMDDFLTSTTRDGKHPVTVSDTLSCHPSHLIGDGDKLFGVTNSKVRDLMNPVRCADVMGVTAPRKNRSFGIALKQQPAAASVAATDTLFVEM